MPESSVQACPELVEGDGKPVVCAEPEASARAAAKLPSMAWIPASRPEWRSFMLGAIAMKPVSSLSKGRNYKRQNERIADRTNETLDQALPSVSIIMPVEFMCARSIPKKG
jgi:hypothetical protein